MEANNAAKLREALKVVRGMVNEELEDLKDISDEVRADFISIRGWCNHALSAPPRNCDVGTADEQGERFKAFCRNHQFVSADSEDGFPPVYVCSNESCPLHDYYIAHGEDDCEIAWSQMPYDSEAAK